MVKYKRLFENEGPKISKTETALFDEIKEMFDVDMNVYSIDNKDSFYLAFSKQVPQQTVIKIFENLEDLGYDHFKELMEDEKKELGIVGNTIIEVIPN